MHKCERLSIVVPCYNEAEIIAHTYKTISQLANSWSNQRKIHSFELIFVDDGSKDNTLESLQSFAKTDHNLKIVALSKNFGHQAALLAGLYQASGNAVVSLDADLQDPPEVIEKMLDKYAEGYEIVLGVRDERKTDSFFKKTTAHIFYTLMHAMGAKLIANHADFRLLSHRAIAELKNFSETNLFLRGLIPSLGFKQAIVYYNRDARTAGKTKYPLGKMISFAIEGITSFSYLPLRLASILGIFLALGSLCLTVWVLLVKISGQSVPGWTSTVLPMYLLGGIQLLFLGIIGEYIGKIYLETKRRPPFIIKSKDNF